MKGKCEEKIGSKRTLKVPVRSNAHGYSMDRKEYRAKQGHSHRQVRNLEQWFSIRGKFPFPNPLPLSLKISGNAWSHLWLS